MPTIREVANTIQTHNPSIQLYWNTKRNAIGYWSHHLGRVQVLAGELLDGRWAPIPELLVDEKPLFPAEEWEPIPAEA